MAKNTGKKNIKMDRCMVKVLSGTKMSKNIEKENTKMANYFNLSLKNYPKPGEYANGCCGICLGDHWRKTTEYEKEQSGYELACAVCHGNFGYNGPEKESEEE